MKTTTLRVNDLVACFGKLIGRIEYITGLWAGVRQGGRVDEYPLNRLELAR